MCPQYGELRPTSSWDLFTSLGHPCKFQRLSHLGSQVVSVSQTLRRWTEDATCVRQGDHHVGHWPTFLVGYIVERTNTKILEPFFAISILNPNYDVINDVNVVVERCGFHHWIARRISWGEVVSIFLYILWFPSYDVINDVIISDADCTPGRESRSVAANSTKIVV